MTNQPESAPSGAEQPRTPFPFPLTPPSSFGPETIVNPERRGAAAPIGSPDSGLWRRLFPFETDGPADSPAGFELEHFTIEERIGAGGMGAVFRAIDQRLQRVVALKVLAPGHARDLSAVQRFQNEARAAARLDHDNIARVYYVGEDKGLPFIAFEYVTGINVRDLIRETGRLEPHDAVNFTLQIAAALRHTSAAGVVHRDIKPSNIIIAPNGRAKLVDLGLARKLNSESVGELTLAGTTLGTFDYISPEQAKDPRNVDVRSDIYSLGCTLYHMLTGEPPYPEGTVLQKLLDHQGKDPPDPAHKNRRVPAALSSVVQKMMASDPRHRYATPDDLIRDLSIIAGRMGLRGASPEGLVWTQPRVERPRFWERHLGWIATTTLLLAVVLLLNRFPGLGQPPHDAAQMGQTQWHLDGDHPNRDHDPDRWPPPALPPAIPHEPTAGPPERTEAAVGGSASDPSGDLIAGRPNGTTEEPHQPNGDESDVPHRSADSVASLSPSNGTPRRVLDDPELPLLSDRNEPVPPEDPPSGAGRSPGETSSTVRTSEGTERTVAANDTARPSQSPAPAGSDTRPRVDPPDPMPAESESPPAIAIVSASGDATAYPTLEAACSAARDRDIIELRFDGPRGELEKPLRVHNKKITIRAARGFRPLVEFAPGSRTGELRMISVENGSIELINLDVRLTVRDAAADDSALFLLQGSDQIRLEGVSVTVDNPTHRTVAVFDLATGPGGSLERMQMMGDGADMPRPRAFEVRIVKSLVRGAADLFLVRHTRPGEFEIENAVVALDGTLLAVLGDLEAVEGSHLKLRMEHATCLLGNSLLRIDSGDMPREVLPVHVQARNNIFATHTASPLVAMTGNTHIDDFRRMLLRWNGERNFYDRFESFWTIAPMSGGSGFDNIDFEGWKRGWAASSDTAEGNPVYGGIVWKAPWADQTFADLLPADVQLDADAPANPPIAGATNGGDAGADLSQLPLLHGPDEPESVEEP